MMGMTYKQTVGVIFICFVIMINMIVFPVIEIILFPKSKDVQKMYLRYNYGSREALESVRFILLNNGFYNVLCGSAVIYGVYAKNTDLLRAIMYVFIGNAAVGLYQSLDGYIGSLVKAVPSIVAVTYLKFLPNDPTRTDMPWSIVLIPVVLHITFFCLESLLFPRSKYVQKIFLGRAASSPMAVDAATPLLFGIGFYNLFLALGAVHGLISENLTEVKCFVVIFVGASLVLFFSNRKLYRGALIQGGPALLVLYVLCLY